MFFLSHVIPMEGADRALDLESADPQPPLNPARQSIHWALPLSAIYLLNGTEVQGRSHFSFIRCWVSVISTTVLLRWGENTSFLPAEFVSRAKWDKQFKHQISEVCEDKMLDKKTLLKLRQKVICWGRKFLAKVQILELTTKDTMKKKGFDLDKSGPESWLYHRLTVLSQTNPLTSLILFT